MFPKLNTLGEDCMVFDDAVTGARAIPNSVCRDKLPDTELTEYRFNGCGHRTPIECGARPQGTYQMVMLGTSFAAGMRVPVEKTFATLLPEELSRRTGRPIQLYNESMPWRPPRVIAAHIDEVLAAKPDLIFWVLNPSDIGETSRLGGVARPVAAGKGDGLRGLINSARGFLTAEAKNQSTGSLVRILLYHIRTLYVRNYLMRGSDAEFLRTTPGRLWDVSLQNFDSYADEIESKARVTGVPLVVTFLPNRAQAAMLCTGIWPDGTDPVKANDEVRAIIEKHGGTFLDILPEFRKVPEAERYYYPIDGHPDARGHALIAHMLADAFSQSPIGEFRPAGKGADSRN